MFRLVPYRLIDDSELFVVVAHLDVTRHREILAHRMAFEAVIGENPPQVRMVRKEHAVEVPAFPLEPVGGRENIGDGRSEAHTSELQSLMRISYAVFCLKNKNHYEPTKQRRHTTHTH